MSEPVRVMVQMRSTPALAAASFGPVPASPRVSIASLPGVQFDATFSPVPVPPRPADGAPPRAAGGALAFTAAAPATYVVRAAVQRDAVQSFLESARNDQAVVGVFADPRIQPIAICPTGPVGTDLDVEQLLLVDEL